jgi:hypothetical protein
VALERVPSELELDSEELEEESEAGEIICELSGWVGVS